ncbi:hypothetical protein BVX97_02495 [bacterium E08(2017)]|nr:hypothetical protein BVX97_02495 [bacterium E08(2017)]
MKPLGRVEKLVTFAITSLLAVMIFYVLAQLLYSAWCAYTHEHFGLLDYGVYTNFIWNSGHGSLYRLLMDRSYLYTHLSFSLALLGPLFRIWDSPELLIFIQWLFVLLGGGILFLTARKRNIPAYLGLALVFFFVGYRFTQSALMSQFHGVAAYFLLVPWLYYCCSIRKSMAWMPLLLLLGIREDAFIFILPMLLYFAVKDRWMTGYVLFAAALVYGLLAVFWLYPEINGITIMERRSKFLGADNLFKFTGCDNSSRLFGVTMTMLPMLACASRKCLPVFVFPLTAILTAMISGVNTQQSMGAHYSPPVMTMLAVGLLESFSLIDKKSIAIGRPIPIRAVLLISVTIGVHLHSGFIKYGGKHFDIFQEPAPEGRLIARAVNCLPREGVLLTDRKMSAFCANRRDLLCWNKWFDADVHSYDYAFLKLSMLDHVLGGQFLELLAKGEFGVMYYDGLHVILERGGETKLNDQVLLDHKSPPLAPALCLKHAGSDVVLPDGRVMRYWEGEGHRAPAMVCYGKSSLLGPGSYKAIFNYKTSLPDSIESGSWGEVGLYRFNDQGEALGKAEIIKMELADGMYIHQEVQFELDKAQEVEIRITGGGAELWFDVVRFILL